MNNRFFPTLEGELRPPLLGKFMDSSNFEANEDKTGENPKKDSDETCKNPKDYTVTFSSRLFLMFLIIIFMFAFFD